MLVLCSFRLLAYQVQLTWNPSPDTNAIGYYIYYGAADSTYTVKLDAGNNTNLLVYSMKSPVEYFAATAYDSSGNESVFSNQAIYTNQLAVYLGALVSYGTSITNLQTIEVMTYVDDATIGNLYSAQLIITNYAVSYSRPVDTNSYVYLCQLLTLGTNIANLNNYEYDLLCFTNPPLGQFYSQQLIITNNPF